MDAETELFSGWLLLPAGKQFARVDVLRYTAGETASPERIVPANELISEDGRILALTLLSLKPGFQYECRWVYRE